MSRVMLQLGSERLPSAWGTISRAEGLPWGTWLFTWLCQLAPRGACVCAESQRLLTVPETG